MGVRARKSVSTVKKSKAVQKLTPLEQAEAVVGRVFAALGKERVELGLDTFGSNFCCASWQRCFLAHAVGISETVYRQDDDKIERMAIEVGVDADDVRRFINFYDGNSYLISTSRLQEMAYEFVGREFVHSW